MLRFDSDSGNLPEQFPKSWRVYAPSEEALLSGEFYPSVTTVLDSAQDRSGKNFLIYQTRDSYDELMNSAAQKGTELHELFELYLQGNDVDPTDEYRKSFDNFKAIVAKEEIEAVECEVQVFSPAYGYAGSMDLLGTTKGDVCAFEFKTGMYHIKAGWQLAAYRAAYIEQTGEDVPKMMGIQCHRNGDVKKVFRYRHLDECFIAFLSTLNVFRMLEFNKLNSLNWKWVLTNPVTKYYEEEPLEGAA